MQLKGSRVLVTGGAGFVGSHIVDKLLFEDVARVVILDNFLRGSKANLAHVIKNKRIECVQGDIRDAELVNSVCSGINYVFHQAAVRLTHCAKDPRLCQEVMVDGTFNILEACVKQKVDKLIIASSVSVYGEPSYTPIDEDHPYNNTTAYGAAKIANEHMAKAFHYMFRLPIILLRYFNVYGPRMDILGAYTEVLIKWLDKIDKEENPIVHGNGKQSLDFIYVEDVARANILALKSKIRWGVYNIGSGKTTSLKDLVQALIKLTNSKLKPIYEKKVKRPYVQNRLAETSKAERELSFTARLDLEEGLKKLIEWRKNILAKKNGQ